MRTSAILGVLAAAGLVTACSSVQGHEASQPRPVKVQTITAAQPQAGIRYSASIEPFDQVQLAFKASGYVEELLQRHGADGRSRAVQAGDLVAKDTVLARVREAEFRERVEQGRAKRAEGEAGLKKARLDLERAQVLFAADSLTKPDLDSAQASFDSAQARVVASQSDIELALTALRDCALAAPATGVVLERRIEQGSLVGVGSVGFVIGDVSSVKARFGIPDAVIGSISLGDGIGVTVDSLSGASFPGIVTAISPAADPHSRVFDVEVTIKNQDRRLRPGMIGTVGVGRKTAEAIPTLTLSLSAITRSTADPQQYAVFVIERQGDAEVARLRTVELGDVLGNGVAVRRGLMAGDRVITSGTTLLTDGERVRIIP